MNTLFRFCSHVCGNPTDGAFKVGVNGHVIVKPRPLCAAGAPVHARAPCLMKVWAVGFSLDLRIYPEVLEEMTLSFLERAHRCGSGGS